MSKYYITVKIYKAKPGKKDEWPKIDTYSKGKKEIKTYNRGKKISEHNFVTDKLPQTQGVRT